MTLGNLLLRMSYEYFPFFKVASIRRFMEENNINPRKKWGQNFLIDPNIVRLITEQISPDAQFDAIAEIGPGLGSLTYKLAELKKDLYLFEIDPALCAYLRATEFLAKIKFTLFQGDALINLVEIRRKKVYLFGNLPYYITSDLIAVILKELDSLSGGIFMVQREFAERLCHEISSFSVFCSAFGEFRILKNVKASCFYPSPKAESSVIRFIPKKNPLYENKKNVELLELLLKTFFWGKRKTLQKSLSDAPFIDRSGVFSSIPEFRKKILASISKSGIDPKSRPEEIVRTDFHRIVENTGLI